MNDRYLFRGKSLENGKWITGFLGHELADPDESGVENDFYFILSDFARKKTYVDAQTVGQCTGIVDKNGVLIYEGDRLKWNSRKYEIIYKDACFFAISKGFQNWKEYLFDIASLGNIHDNPELMEVVE